MTRMCATMAESTENPPELSSKNITAREAGEYRAGLFNLNHLERQEIAKHLKARAARMKCTGSMYDYKKAERIITEAENFCNCGRQFAMFQCKNDGQRFKSNVSCNSRICPVCGRRYARNYDFKAVQLFKKALSRRIPGYGLKMLTLTTNTARYGAAGPTRKDIVRFYDESYRFFKLFYSKYKCKISAKSGRVIEDQTRYDRGVKRSPKIRTTKSGRVVEDWRRWRGAGYLSTIEMGGKSLMLHCHAIVFGPYIPFETLQRTWRSLTGDSFHVNIKPVRDPETAVKYVLKYIFKAPNVDSFHDIAAYLLAIKGSRRIRTGGIFYNTLRIEKPPKIEKVCPYCGCELEYTGNQIIEKEDAARVTNLWPLLKQRSRGEPISKPDGYRSGGDRIDAALSLMRYEIFEAEN